MFKKRITKPEAGNKYYNTVSNGGYSTAIIGSPTDPGCNVLANCVGYSAGRFNENIGAGKFLYYSYPPNAEDFFASAKAQKLRTGCIPDLGAIVVWSKGKAGVSGDGAGHVANIEEVQSDGTLLTSESGWGCKNPFWTNHREFGNGNIGAGNEYHFLGFVYLPDEYRAKGECMPVVKEGDRNDAVRWLQNALIQNGYLRRNELDGDFGLVTLGAVLAWQLKHNLDVDGIVGPKTWESLRMG